MANGDAIVIVKNLIMCSCIINLFICKLIFVKDYNEICCSYTHILIRMFYEKLPQNLPIGCISKNFQHFRCVNEDLKHLMLLTFVANRSIRYNCGLKIHKSRTKEYYLLLFHEDSRHPYARITEIKQQRYAMQITWCDEAYWIF